MLDVDWFKKYNDHYGHQAGDDCLRQVADIISAHVCRTGDLVARYGGEEFVIIIPRADRDSALAIANKICRNLEAQAVPHAMSELGCVTISIGVTAMVPSTGVTSDVLVETADAALYRAKKLGRNQVVLA